MLWLLRVLPVLLLVSVANAQELELFLKNPVPREAPSQYPASLSIGQVLDFPPAGYTHKLDLFPGIEVLDRLRLELPGVLELAPPEAINGVRREKLLDHFPRFGLYMLLDADTALYVTERYDLRRYVGKLIARKDLLFSSETIPADLAITVLDKDPYHRRTKDNFEIGFYGRLPFEVDLGFRKLRSEVSVGYDDHAKFVALLRVHLGE
ncbi:MAG: hypothetical protein AAB367_00450 [Patescibacteria group bacterium]